jgi:2-(1,2-epoxy-1,2-dihydrophenyl)acetyl-CoA isomerase
MTDPAVLLTVDDGIATITLNRAAAMNSLDVATKVLLRDTVLEVAEDVSVRCVVLTGSGRAFCVGQDLREHAGLLASGSSEELFATVVEHYNPIVTALATMPKPVLAAVNGVAAGAGAGFAFACDLRIVAESAGFNLAFSQVALSCDSGSSWTLPRLVGHSRALDLMYFPRTVGAEEAGRIGLADLVVPDTELAQVVGELARRLADGPTLALGAIRRSVAYAAQHDFGEALAFEATMMNQTGASADHAEAVAAFLEKRRPTYER